MMRDIVLTHVSKQYDGEPLPSLSDISLAIKSGEFLAVIGPSGCGKSTLLKVIAGLERIERGSAQLPEKVAMTFQFGALFPWLTVFENVALGLRTEGSNEAYIKEIVRRELDAMRIVEHAYKYPSELSGGQRQRVGIARALAVNPAVLLLDEPFSALDPQTTAELHDDILRMWHRTGKTIILVSHIIEEAVSMAERIVLMKAGKIEATFGIDLPYPRRESEGFHRDVMKIRRRFFDET